MCDLGDREIAACQQFFCLIDSPIDQIIDRGLEAMAQALLEVETINHKQVENLFKYHSIYAPGEEPKQEESEFSPPPMDDGYGLPSFTN